MIDSIPAALGPLAAQTAVELEGHRAARPGLVMDLETMARRLGRELQRGPTLDAYLLAAGIAQIADDHVHALTYPVGLAARYLERRETRAAQLAGAAAAMLDRAARAARARRSSTHVVMRWRRGLEELAQALADVQIGALIEARERERAGARAPSAGRPVAGPGHAWAGWSPELERLPAALRDAVVRLPSCFCHFDQRPADIVTLACRFADRWPDRQRPLLVVGVRTSGSHLAPLCAASLRAMGFRRVSTVTVRPQHGLLASERALIRAVGRHDGLALVLDDPPVTGGSVRDATAMLRRAGLRADAIVLLLATFGAADLPATLRGAQAVLLARDEWSVEADLKPAAVRGALQAFGGARCDVEAEPVALPAPEPTRGHRRALFRVRTVGAAGERSEHLMLVEGVGLGYLGAHRVAAPALVARFSPAVLGLRDGLLYREWLAGDRRLEAPPSDEQAVAGELAGYAAERRAMLACPRDLGVGMVDEQPAWLVASRILSAGFGRGWPVARVLATDRATRRVLRVARPSVVDGNTDLAQWFRRDGPGSPLLKPDVGEDGFSNLDAQCFDAVFDLAGVTARTDSRELPGRLRRAFGELTGEAVSEERWLLYELVHLWGRERTQPAEARQLRRARGRAVQRYFADAYLGDVSMAAAGPLCALDVDGVLEAERLGFPALTPAAALALRALLAHGYRPVLATGRSLGEAAERCRAFGLAGAVAEYGSATFRTADERVQTLLEERQVAALDRLRAALAELDDVVVGPDHRHAVRAWSVRGGRRGPLPDAQAASAVARAEDGAIRVIAGEGQTDFVAGGIDKGTGLRALAAELGNERARPYALAVGDTAADLPFAALAARACAPGHADPMLARAGFQMMARSYQAGLVQAVAGLLGHPPGGCPRCRLPAASPERAITRGLLGVPGRGRLGMIGSVLELWWRGRP